MMTSILLITLLLDGKTATLEPVLNLAPISEGVDAFLEGPQVVDFDDRGNIYLLDTDAKKVFVWDANGAFLRCFGNEGQAPGEFLFSRRRGGSSGFLNVGNNEIVIYDGAKRSASIFGMTDFKFKKVLAFNFGRSRVSYFSPMGENRYIVKKRSRSDSGLFNTVGIYDAEGAVINEMIKIKDESFSRRGGSGRNRRFQITAFAPSVVVHYNAAAAQLIVGDSTNPSFQVLDQKGAKLRQINLKIPREEVTDADRKEFSEQSFIKNSNRVTAVFPDKKAYYDHILPVGKDRFLVYNASPLYRNIVGYLVGNDGVPSARFTLSCGENGNLLGARGRLLAVMTDDEGEFQIREVKVQL